MIIQVSRKPLPRLPDGRRKRVIFCGNHHAGWSALSSFVEPWNWCYAHCDVVAVVPDRKDQPNAVGSLWEKDKSKWRIQLVPKLAKKYNLRIENLDLWPGALFNSQLRRLVRETGAEYILSSTFRGIFRQEVLDEVEAAYNIHPNGIAVDVHGTPRIEWPQPLFEGKQAFDLMFEMARKYEKGDSELDCQAMEWVIHKILPPPGVDRGEFVGANRCPIPLPHQEQHGRDPRKMFNGAQSHCSAAIAELLHHFGPHMFAGGKPPWRDPRMRKAVRGSAH